MTVLELMHLVDFTRSALLQRSALKSHGGLDPFTQKSNNQPIAYAAVEAFTMAAFQHKGVEPGVFLTFINFPA